jgi:hypothetical protein
VPGRLDHHGVPPLEKGQREGEGGKEEALHKIVGLQNRTWLLIEHVEKYTERQVETFCYSCSSVLP